MGYNILCISIGGLAFNFWIECENHVRTIYEFEIQTSVARSLGLSLNPP